MQMYCTQCGNAIRPNAKFCSTCGAPVIPAQPQRLQPGDILNSVYRVQRALSKGGMGAIYLAEDQNAFGRQRVVKEMLDYFDTNDPQQVANAQRRFEDEARTLAQLRHPGIPDIHAHFTASGRHYIVMEYVEGDDLESLLGKKLPPAQILNYGIQVCQILEYLGKQKPPVIHHDIKPANIVINRANNTARLVDFGTARARLAAQAGGKVGVQKSSIYGTEGYAPPEQYKGQSEPRSDIYALAATLYHLLTDDDPGSHPFLFPQLSTLPSALRTALERALESQAAKRSSATQFRQALESASKSLTRQSKQLTNPPAISSHESYAIVAEKDVSDSIRSAIIRYLTNKLNMSAMDAEVLTWTTPGVYAKGLNTAQAVPLEKELIALGLQARQVLTSQNLSWRVNASNAEVQRLNSQADLAITTKRYPADNLCHCYHCGREWTTRAASVTTLPSICSKCGSTWYEHRIFRCTCCGHEFAHADLKASPLSLFPQCPVCKSAGWHPRNHLTLQRTHYTVDAGELVTGQTFQARVALSISTSTIPLRGRVTTNTAWLQIPTPALTSNQLLLDGNSVGLLSKRSHIGSATVISNAGAAKIEITMQTVDPPRLVVPNRQLDFGTVEGTTKTSRPISIKNGGDQLLDGHIENIPPWLQLNIKNFKGNSTEIICTLYGERLSGPGRHTAKLSVISNGGQETITVSASIPPTTLVVHPVALNFGIQPAKKKVYGDLSITNPGISVLDATVSSSTPWLSVDKQRFRANQTRLRVSVDTRKLQAGQLHNGSLTITSNGGTGVIPVKIQVALPARIIPVLKLNPWLVRLAFVVLAIPFLYFAQMIVWSAVSPGDPTPSATTEVAHNDPEQSTSSPAPPTRTPTAIVAASVTASATASTTPTPPVTPSPTSTRLPSALATATRALTDALDVAAAPEIMITGETLSPLATPQQESSPFAQPSGVRTQSPTATPTNPPKETSTPIPTVTPTDTPASTPTSTPTDTPSPPTPTATLPAPVCADPRSVITSPASRQLLSGQAAVTGTAVHSQFKFYKLELAVGANAQSGYSYLAGGEQPVRGGTLAVFPTTTLPNGTYTLRLTVVDQNGNYPSPCEVTIQIRN